MISNSSTVTISKSNSLVREVTIAPHTEAIALLRFDTERGLFDDGPAPFSFSTSMSRAAYTAEPDGMAILCSCSLTNRCKVAAARGVTKATKVWIEIHTRSSVSEKEAVGGEWWREVLRERLMYYYQIRISLFFQKSKKKKGKGQAQRHQIKWRFVIANGHFRH